MKNRLGFPALLILAGAVVFGADKQVVTIHSYVDSDVCSRLMLGSITDQRIECSKSTHKDGSAAVLVSLADNVVMEVDKQKAVKGLVGGYADVSGEVKGKAARIKVQSATAVQKDQLPKDAFGKNLLEVRPPDMRIHEQIRHQLAMMPYLSDYDFLSFTMNGNDVFLTGWTLRPTNSSEAYNRIKTLEGIGTIVNNIEVLPVSGMDNQIRAATRAKLQQLLPSYFWGSGSAIKVVVKDGDIILIGAVRSEGDKNLAAIQCQSVPGSYHVFNMLTVQAPEKKTKKG